MEENKANILKIINKIREAEKEAKLIKQKGEKEAEDVKESYRKEVMLIKERGKEMVEKERDKIIAERKKITQGIIDRIRKESEREAKEISSHTLKDYQVRNLYEEFVSLIGRV